MPTKKEVSTRPNPQPQRAIVLVVDDEPLNRALCKRILDPEYEVLEAADGLAALEAVKRAPPDLVLLDVMMPGMNGFETCLRIKRASPDYLPVVFLTSLNEQGERNAGLRAGADDFLGKPFDRHELLLRVATFVRLRRQDVTIRQQMERLRKLEELKDDLASLLVHDLRNPLAGMIAYLQVMREEMSASGQSDQLDDLDQALVAAGRMRGALNEMLRLRQLESNALKLRRERLSLSDAVAEALATAQGEARARNVELRCANEGEAVIDADRDLVIRSVENLVHNAVRYSPPASAVEVTIRAEDGGAHVEVADRGPGVPDEMKDRIFDKFATVEARHGKGRSGFGLGLYLVHMAVTAHGGTASVRDRVGGGSVFSIFFPGPK
jgi:signal transduction histidine kinase